MNLKVFLASCFCVWALTLTAQPKMSWYYPALGTVKPISKKAKGVYIGMNVEISDCVKGNCKNGDGEFIRVSRVSDSAFRAADIEPALDIIRYSGKFSDDGKKFEGNVYKRRVYYDVTNAGNDEDARMTPKEALTTDDESFWQGQMTGKGSMRGENYNMKNVPARYTWDGWMEGRPDFTGLGGSSPYLEYARAFYQWNTLKYVELFYNSSSAYKKIKASVRPGGALLGAVIEYNDGSRYEGMLCRGTYHGPGKYSNAQGKIKQGIWMFDSLASSMDVVIPKAFVEPVTLEESQTKRMQVVNLTYGLHDAGGGWMYGWGQVMMTLIKMKDDDVTGPGLVISFDEDQWKLNCTYRSGDFLEGSFDKGMLARETLEKKGNSDLNGERYTYSHASFSTVAGEIKNDRLLSGCAVKTWYDADNLPTRLLEGEFYSSSGSSGEERPSGWMLQDDWAGLRDAAHLHYYYAGWDIMELTKEADWIIKAGPEADSADFCYPALNALSQPLLKKLKERGDSILAVRAAEKNEMVESSRRRAAEYNSPEAVAKRKKQVEECAAASLRNTFGVGWKFDLPEEGNKREMKFFITGPYDCKTHAYPGDYHYWQYTIKDKGFFVAVPGNASPEQLKYARKTEGIYAVCGNCKGKGRVELTEMTKVNLVTSYKVEHGKFVVNTSEPAWMRWGIVDCNSCDGRGYRGK